MWKRLHVKYSLFLSDFTKLEFSRQILKNWISNFIKIRLVGAELLHADGRTWRSSKSLFAILRTRLKTGTGELRCSDCSTVPLLQQPCVVLSPVSHDSLKSHVLSCLQYRTTLSTALCCPVSSIARLSQQPCVVLSQVSHDSLNSPVLSCFQYRTALSTALCCPVSSIAQLSQQRCVVLFPVSHGSPTALCCAISSNVPLAKQVSQACIFILMFRYLMLVRST